MCPPLALTLFFFYIPPATTLIYTLSLHDALPISLHDLAVEPAAALRQPCDEVRLHRTAGGARPDRKSTRLNSSHVSISYAVFCLKKKKKNSNTPIPQR